MLAQNYYTNFYSLLQKYYYLFDLFNLQKKYLIEKYNHYDKFNNDYENCNQKIELLELLIYNIKKNIKMITNINVEIKNQLKDKNMNVKSNVNYECNDIKKMKTFLMKI